MKREEKERKERHREKESHKSHKHKSGDREKDRHHSRKEHKSSRHSSDTAKDVKKEKCDKDYSKQQQGEKSKHKSESGSGSSSGRRTQELTKGYKSDNSYKHCSTQDLSSIDIFKNVVDDCDEEPKSKKRSSHSEDRDDAQSSKRSRMEPPSVGASSLGPSLLPDISPIYKPLPRVNMSQYERAADDRNKDEESLSLLLSNKSRGRSAIYR